MRPLTERGLSRDPVRQFSQWFAAARRERAIRLPEACCLCTVGVDGYPEGRVVLLKSFDAAGFVFYSNMNSRKGRALARRPRAALVFYWERLNRQVRVVGDAEPVSAAEADRYFRSRPRGSQLSAWASEQSEPVAGRALLEARMRALDRRYPREVPRPSHWSGWRIRPREIEFWQNRDDRLHDRFLFRRAASGAWKRPVRLCP